LGCRDRFGKPEEVGKVNAFLSSDAAPFMIRIDLPIDGG
jgi:NAD(P)-dependent dehydrogenase (short-subunit alcohol dehydrogenase family)